MQLSKKSETAFPEPHQRSPRHMNPELGEPVAETKHSPEQVPDPHSNGTDDQCRIDCLTDRLVNVEADLAAKDMMLASLKGRLRASEGMLKNQRQELDLMRRSISWQVVERFQRRKEEWFPLGSLRRRMYAAIVTRLAWVFLKKKFSLQALGRSPNPGQTHAAASAEILLHCNEPKRDEFYGGTIAIKGWAWAPSGIERIDVMLDGQALGGASYGMLRPDVMRAYPRVQNAELSGFLFSWNTATVEEGLHQLDIIATAKNAAQRTLVVPVVVDQSRAASDYNLWIQLNEPGPEKLRDMAQEAERFSYQPLLSVVVPVYKTPIKVLREAIESVRSQIYSKWELCLVDDGSGSRQITDLLSDYQSKDTRIRFTQFRENQGISNATNAAISLARGEFVCFLDHDDTLSANALYSVVELLQQHHDADVIYSDEDKLDLTGNRCEPFFKPDWSPDLLLSMNYMRHFLVARREWIESVGGFRSECDGSQDYDLVLRITEKTHRIQHVPHVLYHQRVASPFLTTLQNTKSAVHIAASRAIADYLQRNRIAGHVEEGIAPGRWRVRYEIKDTPRTALIIPAGRRVELLRTCLESIFSKTTYANFEVMVVDNSKGADVQQLLAARRTKEAQLTYVDYRNKPFNFSAINNFAVRQTTAPLVVFLNDDTEIVNDEWLAALVEHGQRPKVGVVGAKLLYHFGLIQHAGIVMGIHEGAGHAFKHLPADSRSFFDFPQVVRNCSAVTAACMLTKRDLFLQLGGFNETELAVAFQDPDYCLRVRQAGFLVVYTPYAVLIHHESATRGSRVNPAEVRYMQEKWRDVIAQDPYYSPNLSRTSEDYALRLD
jgi:O-antigen biosynthesis protein